MSEKQREEYYEDFGKMCLKSRLPKELSEVFSGSYGLINEIARLLKIKLPSDYAHLLILMRRVNNYSFKAGMLSERERQNQELRDLKREFIENEKYPKVNAKLYKLCISKGITRTDIARCLGVSTAVFAKYFNDLEKMK